MHTNLITLGKMHAVVVKQNIVPDRELYMSFSIDFIFILVTRGSIKYLHYYLFLVFTVYHIHWQPAVTPYTSPLQLAVWGAILLFVCSFRAYMHSPHYMRYYFEVV